MKNIYINNKKYAEMLQQIADAVF